MNRVGKLNIYIVQGADINDVKIVPLEDDDTPIDLTGYTARMQLRDVVESTTVLDDLTTENSRIEISSFVDDDSITKWKVVLKFPDDVTDSYDFERAVYDLEMVDSSNDIDRWLEGEVKVNLNVTRE